MRTRRLFQAGIWMLVLFLTACQVVLAPTNTPLPTSTVVPASSTPAPTSTAVPASPTPTATPAVPRATATVSPTRTATPLPATPYPDTGRSETWDSASPDGTWIVQGLAFFPESGEQYYTQLIVRKTDGTAEWVAVEEWSHFGLGYTTPRPFAWSNDGRYLYWTNVPVPDGCPGLENGSDLQRLDLSDGSNTEVVPPVGLWLALSPDETRLAYRAYGARGLVIRDLATGVEREIVLNVEGDIGHFVWSPDGTALVLVAIHDRCGPPAEQTHSIVRADVTAGASIVLIERSTNRLIPREWPEPERVLLSDDQGNAWWMDPQTGELSPAADAGVWTGVPTYENPAGPARYRLSFAHGQWALAPNASVFGDDKLVHRLREGCQIVPAAGHGLAAGYTVKKGARDLGAVSYEVSQISYQGQPVFANYCTGLAGWYTCFEVYWQQDMEACVADAEAVLTTLADATGP